MNHWKPYLLFPNFFPVQNLDDNFFELEQEESSLQSTEETTALRSFSSEDSVGGCVFISAATVDFESVVVSGCRAANGAGIGVTFSSVQISRSLFSYNGLASSVATQLQGGAGFFEDSSIGITSCDFHSNFFRISNGIVNGGALAFFRCNATLGGATSVNGGTIAVTDASVQGGSMFSLCLC